MIQGSKGVFGGTYRSVLWSFEEASESLQFLKIHSNQCAQCFEAYQVV